MSLPSKIMEQWRHCPAKLWSNADFAPQNHGPFVPCPPKSLSLRILCPSNLWINADFDPQNHGDIVLGTKITTKNPAYRRHWISRPMRRVAPILLFPTVSKKGAESISAKKCWNRLKLIKLIKSAKTTKKC